MLQKSQWLIAVNNPVMRYFFLYPVSIIISVILNSACSPQPDASLDGLPSNNASNSKPAQASLETKTSSTKSKINDTGITWGGNYPKDINGDCTGKINPSQLPEGYILEGDILAQQDCMHGRDADGKGAAFAYTKVSATGEPLDEQAKTWACVRDSVTGLMWEVKLPTDSHYGNAGLHDGDDLFTWYNANIEENGGAVGDWNAQGQQCAGYVKGQPMTYCHIDEFVRRVNEETLCGFSDWRVPSRPELEGLVHFGTSRPAIEKAFFPNTRNEFYWSRSAVASFPAMAWGVSFQFGYSAPLQRNNARPVRLVRSGEK